MFSLGSEHRYHLYSEPTDMRKSFDGLSGIIRNQLDRDPSSGDVFLFINKSRDKVKLLHWDGCSFVLYYKRLESGTFEVPKYDSSVQSIRLSYSKLVLLIEGLSIKNIVRRVSSKPTLACG